jgi:hypothetical protein
MKVPPIFIQFLEKKFRAGGSPTVLICGPTNAGKTWAAAAIGEYFNNDFDADRQMSHNVKDFILSIKNNKGKVLILDEGETELAGADWWEFFNKKFGIIIQTQRYRNNIYIVIMPMAKSLAPSHRRMINAKIVMEKQGVGKVFWVLQKWGEMRGFKKEFSEIFLGFVEFARPICGNQLDKIGAVEKNRIMEQILDDTGKREERQRLDDLRRKVKLDHYEKRAKKIGVGIEDVTERNKELLKKVKGDFPDLFGADE